MRRANATSRPRPLIKPQMRFMQWPAQTQVCGPFVNDLLQRGERPVCYKPAALPRVTSLFTFSFHSAIDFRASLHRQGSLFEGANKTSSSQAFLSSLVSVDPTLRPETLQGPMSYNVHRYNTLCRLGIEELPPLPEPCDAHRHRHRFFGDLPVRTMPVSARISRTGDSLTIRVF